MQRRSTAAALARVARVMAWASVWWCAGGCARSGSNTAPLPRVTRPGELGRETRVVTTRHNVRVELEAGALAVPENRSRPTGRVIEIPFYRLRSTAARPATPIFLLAGGPGSSWLDLFEDEENFEQVAYFRTIADVVLFDQRGGGRSKPALGCEGEEKLPLDRPVTAAAVAAAMRKLSLACRERWAAAGVDLGGLTTVENATDVDALRAALGYEKMSLVGYSYGTHLALALMRQYPATIDRVVLSGVEGPDHTWDNPSGKLATLARIAAAAEASPAFRGRIPDGGLLAALRTVIQRLEARPVTVMVRSGWRRVPVVVDATMVRFAASAQAGRRSRAAAWPNMILGLHRGDYEQLARRSIDGRTLRPPPPMHSMMDCASGISPERAARYAQDPATELLGDINLEYRAVCDVWRAPDLGAGFRAPVVSDIPTLLLHGTWDVSTPIENAREVASTLSHGQLVEVVEGGHGAIYNLFKRWPPMRSELAKFLRGEPVRFPPEVRLVPPVSFEAEATGR